MVNRSNLNNISNTSNNNPNKRYDNNSSINNKNNNNGLGIELDEFDISDRIDPLNFRNILMDDTH
jgi:hypothetical protein